MWQIQYVIAMEREAEHLRELEQRRRLADAVRSRGAHPGWLGSALRSAPGALAGLLRGLAVAAGVATDRPIIGPHHL